MVKIKIPDSSTAAAFLHADGVATDTCKFLVTWLLTFQSLLESQSIYHRVLSSVHTVQGLVVAKS